jgi:hypothetical protein
MIGRLRWIAIASILLFNSNSPAKIVSETKQAVLNCPIAFSEIGNRIQAAVRDGTKKVADTIESTKKDLNFYLQTAASPVYRFKAQSTYPLPTAFIERLKTSPIVQSLKSDFGDGAGMTIQIPLYDKTFARTGRLDGVIVTGESTQAIFVEKVLREIFPKAKIISGSSRNPSAFVLDIADYHESTGDIALSLVDLEMGKLKIANPGPGIIDQKKVRQTLGISAEAKVISINNAVRNVQPHIDLLISQAKATDAQVLMVSKAGLSSSEFDHMTDALRKANPEFEIIRLSKMGRKLDSHKRYIVINDTVGRMHVVYSASDLNVAAGAINLGEPTIAGVPTLAFGVKSPFAHQYDNEAFGRAIELAKQTKAVQEINDVEQLSTRIQSLLKGKTQNSAFVPPYVVPREPSGSTPLDDFLSQLADRLTLQADSTPLWNVKATDTNFRDRVTNLKIDRLKEFSDFQKKSGRGPWVKSGYLFSKEKFNSLPDLQKQNVLNAFREIGLNYLSTAEGYVQHTNNAREAWESLIRFHESVLVDHPALYLEFESAIEQAHGRTRYTSLKGSIAAWRRNYRSQGKASRP